MHAVTDIEVARFNPYEYNSGTVRFSVPARLLRDVGQLAVSSMACVADGALPMERLQRQFSPAERTMEQTRLATHPTQIGTSMLTRLRAHNACQRIARGHQGAGSPVLTLPSKRARGTTIDMLTPNAMVNTAKKTTGSEKSHMIRAFLMVH